MLPCWQNAPVVVQQGTDSYPYTLNPKQVEIRDRKVLITIPAVTDPVQTESEGEA